MEHFLSKTGTDMSNIEKSVRKNCYVIPMDRTALQGKNLSMLYVLRRSITDLCDGTGGGVVIESEESHRICIKYIACA